MGKVINGFVESVRKRLPGVDVRVDEPVAKAGMWHVDITRGKHAVVLQWSPQKGFGLSAEPNPGLGEGPHEVFEYLEEALDRVVHLIESGEHTRPPQEAFLPALRDLLGVSQETMAAKLKIGQANLSKLERQSDMKISTLRKLMTALGVELELIARVRGVTLKLTQFTLGRGGQAVSPRTALSKRRGRRHSAGRTATG